MKTRVLAIAFITLASTLIATTCRAEQTLALKSGVTTVHLDTSRLASWGVLVDLTRATDSTGGSDALGFIITPKGKANFTPAAIGVSLASSFSMAHVGGFVLTHEANVLKVLDFVVTGSTDSPSTGVVSVLGSSAPTPVLTFSLGTLHFDPRQAALILDLTDLLLTRQGADALGLADRAGAAVGSISFMASASNISGSGKTPTSSPKTPGPDLTFCAIAGLAQVKRQGDVAGLSLSTTSWNVGNQRLDWYRYPSWRHPFIVRNLYRVSDERIEQIGESGVKHGFFALSDSQCGGGCEDPTDGRQLGAQCTDTYDTFTNADQGSLGPRYEINPWTGFFDPTTSHLRTRHPHDGVQHLLRVHDRDLDLGSSYIAEAYYVQYQDANPMNNAAWKPVRLSAGQAGGTWQFDMSPEETPPTIGFAIDAWPGAQKNVLAVVNPPLKGHSSDGRCIIAAKPQRLQDGTWRYEYAIENIDMDRGLKAFRLAIKPGVRILDGTITFHASEHENDELNLAEGVQMDNSSWEVVQDSGSLTWRTTKNPLRWGTLYNFGFTADAGPVSLDAEFSLFKTGTPLSVHANVVGPGH